MELNTQQLQEKWSPVLDAEDAGTIKDAHRRAVTAVVLENQEKAFAAEKQQMGMLTEVAANATGASIDNWDPILISLVRRATPNLLAFDIAGVQPMTGPTGLIFAMKSRYSTQTGTESHFNEADTDFSGDQAAANAHAGGGDPFHVDYAYGIGMSTSDAEKLGNTGNAFKEMAFSIDKTSVTAKSRALKAQYTMELAQDLKAVHGLNAESELANILSTEILAEMNREVIRSVNADAVLGSANTAVAGTFNLDVDADGRWAVEKFKGLVTQIERECNEIAISTRRGKGNFVVTSGNVAAALSAAGVLDTGLGITGKSPVESVDTTGNLFAGTLNGKIKVYVDPYASVDYVTVGYKGSNPYDAGVFYCPYVPLSMMKTIGENDFQPRIGFKTRYGMVNNPFTTSLLSETPGAARSNVYFRIFKVTNL
jgi:hypothetical protein